MITERAMLAAIHISIWTAVKHDRKVSHEVASQHGAPVSAGRYNKQLLRGAGRLDDLRTLAGQIRAHFYKITLPWSDEGYRLLPAHFYFELSARMREFEQSFSKQVDDFLDFYPSYIEHVRPELNGLFREEAPVVDPLSLHLATPVVVGRWIPRCQQSRSCGCAGLFRSWHSGRRPRARPQPLIR
jgi:hypothetical protein